MPCLETSTGLERKLEDMSQTSGTLMSLGGEGKATPVIIVRENVKKNERK